MNDSEGPVVSVEGPSTESIPMSEVMQRFNFVDYDQATGVMVVSEKPKELAAPRSVPSIVVPPGEYGSSSPSPFTSWIRQEYNQALFGVKGLQVYDKMRKSDGTVRSTLRMLRTPILAGDWYIEPASESTRDQNVANFIWQNLTEWMSISWLQFLYETTLMAEFGYYMFEKVFTDQDPRAAGKVIWKKLAPRHPMDVAMWNFDSGGGPVSVEFWPWENMTYQNVIIPIEKMVVFTLDKEANNIQGISALRSAYKHWYYKDTLYKIDSIQKERHGIGIPIITLPPNFDAQDKKDAQELGRNLRTNERAHVVLPPNWTIMFAKLEGQPVNALDSVQMHNEEMWNNILAGFMGSKLMGTAIQALEQFFLKATKYMADIVADTINKHCIPQLVDYNWMRVGYPKLCVRSIADQTDTRTLTFGLRNLVGSQLLTPDDRLEAMLRKVMDLPPQDKATSRQPPAPQAPGVPAQPAQPHVGPPRQSPTAPNGPARGNAGQDNSGG